MLLAAAMDDVDIPWRVGRGRSGGGLDMLLCLMEHCLEVDPSKRPTCCEIQGRLRGVLAHV